jgi:hypothetical protein
MLNSEASRHLSFMGMEKDKAKMIRIELNRTSR